DVSRGENFFSGHFPMSEDHGCCHKHDAAPTRVTRPDDIHALYTCPMHPEVSKQGPGSCPKCGMALEPAEVSLSDAPDPELLDMARRFRVAAVLTLPLLLVAMGEMIPGVTLPVWLHGKAGNWLQFSLATPVVLWSGYPLFLRGW